MMRFLRLFTLVVVAFVFLSACSRTSFFYHRIPTFISWSLDDYVTLDRAQQRQLDQALNAMLEWHQTEELPAYLALLDEIINNLNARTPLVLEDVYRWQTGVEDFGKSLQVYSMSWVAPLALTATDKQLAEIRAALDKKQLELVGKYADRSDEAYRKKARDNLNDNLADYLGRLTSEQKDQVDVAVQDLQRYDSVWLERRAAWFDGFYALMAEQSPQLESELLDFLLRSERAPSAEYLNNNRVLMTAVVTVLNMRSDKQHAKLMSKLTNLRDDLATLVPESSP